MKSPAEKYLAQEAVYRSRCHDRINIVIDTLLHPTEWDYFFFQDPSDLLFDDLTGIQSCDLAIQNAKNVAGSK
jgi:hypothetical protein